MPSIAEIAAIKQAHESELLKLSGVTGVDVGFKYVDGKKTEEIAVRVFVEQKKGQVTKAERVPATIQGVKTDVIQAKFVLNPLLVKIEDLVTMADTTRYDPLRGGMSLGPCRSVYLDAAAAACHGGTTAGYYYFGGTLGAIVVDKATKAKMLLSNFHVMCVDNGWAVGDNMTQPAMIDGGNCPADVVGALQRAALTAAVDAAVCSQTARGYQCSILDIGYVTGTAVATVGMAVRKRGRTTGLTYGNVDGINLTAVLDYCNGIGSRTLTNQISIKADPAKSAAFGKGGDSGSVVVDSSGAVVGLYFAGDTSGAMGVANPIADVLTALNINICGILKKIEAEPISPIKKKIEGEPIKSYKEPIYKGQEPIHKGYEPIYKGYEPIHKGYEPYKGNEPYMPGIGQPPQPPSVGGLEERVAQLEAALAQLTHFISPEARPETDTAPLQNETEFS